MKDFVHVPCQVNMGELYIGIGIGYLNKDRDRIIDKTQKNSSSTIGAEHKITLFNFCSSLGINDKEKKSIWVTLHYMSDEILVNTFYKEWKGTYIEFCDKYNLRLSSFNSWLTGGQYNRARLAFIKHINRTYHIY